MWWTFACVREGMELTQGTQRRRAVWCQICLTLKTSVTLKLIFFLNISKWVCCECMYLENTVSRRNIKDCMHLFSLTQSRAATKRPHLRVKL